MFTPAPPKSILRKMGYLSDQGGLISRYLREHESWHEHLKKSREFILRCLEGKNARELVVLGSGWLLDFPLEELAGNVKSIFLTDISHPPQIIKKVSKFAGVECVQADITGYAQFIFDRVEFYRKNKQPYTFSRYQIPKISRKEGRFFVSLNVLNQLDIFLADYIRSRVPSTEENIRLLRQDIQMDHMKIMKDNNFIFITDHIEILTDKIGHESSRCLIHTEFPEYRHSEEWMWHFDSDGSYNPGKTTTLKIKALCSELPGTFQAM